MDGFKRPQQPRRPEERPAAVSPQEGIPRAQTGYQQPEVPTSASGTDTRPQATVQEASIRPITIKKRRKWPFIVGAIFLLIIVGSVAAISWYHTQLQPADPSDSSVQRVEIKDGVSFGFVADSLKERGIIRSSVAFSILASLEGKRDLIKAGTCDLMPSEHPKEILQKITEGCHDFKSITFYPGATLNTSLYAKNYAAKNNKEFKDSSIYASLSAAGYSDEAIAAAFSANYSGPLFADKPADEGLEGYVFGETYYVDEDATAQEVLQTAFDHMYEVIQKNDLVAKFKAQGLTLYQGITLASIVEKELDCEGKPTEERKERCYGYQQRIAEVFYNRLHSNMSLGSDVTAIYASDMLNVTSSIDVDSPYNTRKYAGLTPGPIATPGELALRAVGNPTVGDDLYFLAGDDGLIYFATTDAGHTANIKNHCQQLCGDL